MSPASEHASPGPAEGALGLGTHVRVFDILSSTERIASQVPPGILVFRRASVQLHCPFIPNLGTFGGSVCPRLLFVLHVSPLLLFPRHVRLLSAVPRGVCWASWRAWLWPRPCSSSPSSTSWPSSRCSTSPVRCCPASTPTPFSVGPGRVLHV